MNWKYRVKKFYLISHHILHESNELISYQDKEKFKSNKIYFRW